MFSLKNLNSVLKKNSRFSTNESSNKYSKQNTQRSNLHHFKMFIPENVQNRQYQKRPNKLL